MYKIFISGFIPFLSFYLIFHKISISCHSDVLKSDSALIRLPELELELSHGTLGGLYTTVEGLLLKIARNLGELNPFVSGDSTRLHHSSSNEMSEVR